jgi:hypothetical protein
MGTSARADRTLTVSGAAEWAPRVGDYSIPSSDAPPFGRPVCSTRLCCTMGRRASQSEHPALPVHGINPAAHPPRLSTGFPACSLRRLAGAISPVVIRTRHRAQVLIRSDNEMSRLVAGQCRIVLLQTRSHLISRRELMPKLPAHVVTVFQHRRVHSDDACRPRCSQEALNCGMFLYRVWGSAGRCRQRYSNNSHTGTD